MFYDETTGRGGKRNITPGQPVYDIKTTSGAPYTDLAQPSGSAGLHGHGTDRPIEGIKTAHGDHYDDTNRPQAPTGTDRSMDNTSATTAATQRPDAYPHGHAPEASVASIKSGVIGFGAGDPHGHAAMSTHNPTQEHLGQDQVVGGGKPGTAGMTEGRGIQQGSEAQTYPQTHATRSEPTGVNSSYTGERQVLGNTPRQESYTADTNREFPLTGGVVSDPTKHPLSARDTTEHTSAPHDQRELGKEERVNRISNSPVGSNYGREALAGAAAAAAAVGASHTMSRPEEKDVQDQGLATHGISSSQPTTNYHPEALAAATAAASRSSDLPLTAQNQHHVTHSHDQPNISQTANVAVPADGSSSTHERPHNPRLESRHRHIPGEFIATPSDEPTFLDYSSAVEPTNHTASGLASVHEVSPTTDPTPTSGSHELRHTGTLEEPKPRSSVEDQHARDAAIAGGLSAGAAGLGAYAASHEHDTPGANSSQVFPEESSPYSSKTLDPRVLGGIPQLEEQKFDPSAKSGTTSLPQTSKPISSQDVSGSSAPHVSFAGDTTAPISDTNAQQHPSSNLPPSSTDTTSLERQPEHHYVRDAGLVGAGAVAGGGLYTATHDNTTHSGPASNTIGPHSSNMANILDPRVQPDPNQQIHHNIGPTADDPASRTIGPHSSNIANIVDPRVKPDPSKQKGHTTSGPHQSDTLNRLDPKVNDKAGQEHHYGRDAAAVGGAGAVGYGAYEAINAYGDHRLNQPGASLPEQRYDPASAGAGAPNPVPSKVQYDYNDPATRGNASRTDPSDHVNRNTALGGAGLAAAGVGAGAYAGLRHDDGTQQPLPQSFGGAAQVSQPAYQGRDTTRSSYPLDSTTTHVPYPDQGTIAPHNTYEQGPGAQTYKSNEDPTKEDHGKRNAAVLGGAVGAAGLGGAAYLDSQHQDQREADERLKKTAHEREKEQHTLDKEQRHHEQALAKEHEGEEKKKHGLLGFLHRDKSKKEKKDDSTPSPDASPRQSRDYSPRHSKDYGEEQPDSPRWKGKHLLHKDPPKGHPACEVMEHQHEGVQHGVGKREHVGIDGPIGNPDMISGDRETRQGVHSTHPGSDLHHNTTVVEPHTGLPMNTQLGTGAGGLEGNHAIRGLHTHPDVNATTGYRGVDGGAVRKPNAPY
ncbi:cell surface [Pyrenophora seminiperda CCB06]|uniref:Cell surface n=1 Tax=Pyrenophora seminiperda CCB06 TaxID=1302712 RepID=A0A3M7M8N1_9PLEO|nr:cell surface [Pyrenophora seminiperda CCB06]